MPLPLASPIRAVDDRAICCQSLGETLMRRYACPEASLWHRAADALLTLLAHNGLYTALDPALLPPARITSVWSQLVDLLERFLFFDGAMPAGQAPDRRRADELVDVRVVGAITEVVLATAQRRAAPMPIRRRLLGLLERGSLQSVGRTTDADVPVAPRAAVAQACFDALLQYSQRMDGTSCAQRLLRPTRCLAGSCTSPCPRRD